MNTARLRHKLAATRGPTAPRAARLGDVLGEIDRLADELTPADADALVALTIEARQRGDALLDDLRDLIDAYAERWPDAFTAAALPRVSLDDTALIVGVGVAGDSAVVAPLLERVDFARADDEARAALACALGELGGEDARRALLAWQARGDLEGEIRREVEIALAAIDAGRGRA